MEDIRQTVRAFVRERIVLDPAGAAFDDDTNLEECGILDSFSTLNLVTFIEDEFQVELEQADLESGRVCSLTSIEDLVLEKRAVASSCVR